MTQTIIITGASSGIGRALALHYAGPGITMGLLGRDAERLSAIAGQCRTRGADVREGRIDVTAREEMAAWLQAFTRDNPVDILIANAGILAGVEAGQACEDADVSARLMQTNVMGVLNTVHPLLPNMVERKAGHIVIVSSVAALVPLAPMPSYSASKSAVLSYGLALRAGLRRHGVSVSVVCPGYVESPMTDQISGPTPFVVSAPAAAEKIARGIARNKAVIAFPWLLAALLRTLGLLPDRLRSQLLAISRFRVRPPGPALRKLR